MKKLFIFLFCLIFVVCSENGKSVFRIEKQNTYSYTGFDSTGVVIVRGQLTFDFGDSNQVTGQWCFERVGDVNNTGPQVGEGDLTGGLNGEQLWINLNPDYADNNVFLSGILKNNEYTGTWTYSTFAGPVNQGTFEAEK